MKIHKFLIILSILVISIWIPTALSRAGQIIGRSSFSLTDAIGPGAWIELSPGSASVGGISNNSGLSEEPTLVTAPDGTFYLAWNDDTSGNNEIYVLHWDGTTWEEVGEGSSSGGGVSNNVYYDYQPQLALAPDGTLYLAWIGFFDAYVLKWDGNSWDEVGTGSANGGGISNTGGNIQIVSIAIASDGTPYVAWGDYSSGDFEIYIRHWNGNLWEEVGNSSASGGGISNNTDGSTGASVAINPTNDLPCVAWYDYSTGAEDSEIYVRCFDGDSWEELGAGSASGGGISNTPAGPSVYPSLIFDANDMPVIAWSDYDGTDTEIYIRGWDGDSWEELGVGSATGGGLSNNDGDSWQPPSLELSPDGTIYLAWSDDSSGDFEIYVLRWDGTSWQEVGEHSASEGGISNNLAASHTPDLAFDSDGLPYIAWKDWENWAEIFMRRWQNDTISYSLYLPIAIK